MNSNQDKHQGGLQNELMPSKHKGIMKNKRKKKASKLSRALMPNGD